MASEVRRRRVEAGGLEGPAEILIDRWGIPHIYARSQHDLFFAQGWNAARDRLWQLDLWRKRGLGRLAESFGAAHLDQDRASRLFLYRGDMDAEWAAYGPDARAWSTAFADGLNAYVDGVIAGRAPLPVEFRLTASHPDQWSADDLVRLRTHGISNNAESEALRMRVASAGGLTGDGARRRLEPAHDVQIPEGLDLSDIPADLLAPYLKARDEVSFAPAPAARPVSQREEAAAGGSNNWAISAERTATGRPMLASDPHRVLTAPSIRYIAHLSAPGLEVIGSGELHLPGVTIGHNGTAAFGITVFPADQADIYVYELNPENPRQYRYDGGWEDMRVIREWIEVKGGNAEEAELLFTRHGPVLKHEPARRRAFALRSVWNEPGTSAYFSALHYQRAKTLPEFRAALKHWRAAAMNFVYADTHGDIAWQPAGLIPKRPNWDGLIGSPGDGRYEWAGFMEQEELPSLINPARGWVGTANEMNLPPTWAAERYNIGYEWADPGRMQRIAEVLDADAAVTLERSGALQSDVQNLSARRAIALLEGLSSPDPQLSRALELLGAWDCVETTASAAAAIVEVWMFKHLTAAVARRLAPAETLELIATGSPVSSPYASTCLLQEMADRGLRREILLASLGAALGELSERLGPDMGAWRWGDLHHAHFVPAAAALADKALAERMGHGPRPMAGSAYTVNAATYRTADFAMTNGASFRMVVDVGAWDNSLVINTPGQSGDPESPHYSDLFPLWADGKFVPMLWSRSAVEAAAEEAIDLSPAGAGA